jgi:multidrug efflux pump subunit AcrA (membrane-fusion protein)
MQQRSIFRQGALEKMAGLDDLDKLMRVTTPGAWLSLIALLLILLVLLLWSLIGKTPRTTPGQGIFIRKGGVQRIAAPKAGRVTHVAVNSGSTLEAGEELLRLQTSEGKSEILRSNEKGKVLEITTREGMEVQTGAALLTIEPKTALIALIYVPANQAQSVKPGMEARLLPTSFRPEEYGYLRGTVLSISQYPTSPQRMEFVLENSELVRQMNASGSVMEAEVTLQQDEKGEYIWTGAKAPPLKLGSGTLCSAQFLLEQVHPIQMVLPATEGGR